MGFLIDLIEQYGLTAVFLNVLIEQGGAPVPAYPLMLIAGALLDKGNRPTQKEIATRRSCVHF